ncbi:HAL/PAL/TAL family ammonia-lyase [Algicola sagamiensis]|uniref:HAL/PAL/TAL family ammonia-lyase n=1 Tax=Algicola sagamiensis TaxID=163869 RepID=UPI0003829668|nr:aromatic amino acid ammonia-lyase [Algicola sagamiensis]
MYNPSTSAQRPVLILGEQDLTLEQIAQVASGKLQVSLTQNTAVLSRVKQAYDYIQQAIQEDKLIYGVNSGFGGMADVRISKEETEELQNNALWFLRTGTGKPIANEDVRAAMLIRAHSHLYGASGVRLALIERMILFLNQNVTPQVFEYGSIGASGDLVPLSHITGALIGADASYKVDFNGVEMDAISALEKLGLSPLRLHGKEGLAMVNGTSVTTAIAARNIYRAKELFQYTLEFHGAAMQGLNANPESFEPYIHQLKPHSGQINVAQKLHHLLAGSQLTRDHSYEQDELAQDRYSIRCAPQYLGPIEEGLTFIEQQITQEVNSVTDNPLIDFAEDKVYHGGNFLAQYVGIGMDQLRYYIGLLAKHIDVQIAMLVHPEFSNQLPKSLVGNSNRSVNMGLKGLQICGNSMMPMLTFLGNTFVDRFPTHAEQFNQNINSLGYGSALFARESLEILQRYLAIASIFAVQSVDLRCYLIHQHYCGNEAIAPQLKSFYEAVYQSIEKIPAKAEPMIFDDNQQCLSSYIQQIFDMIEERISRKND